MLLTLAILYFPRHLPYNKSPKDYGIDNYKVVKIDSISRKGKKIKLNGWWIPSIEKPIKNYEILFAKKNNAATILVTHGHGSNIGKLDLKSDSVIVKGMLPFYYAGYNILAIDLRNHGKSQNSKPLTFGYYESDDILAGVEWIKRNAIDDNSLDPEKIVVWAESMGAAAAILATAKDREKGNIKALICESPYADFASPLKIRLKKFKVSFLSSWVAYWFDVFSPIKLKEISPVNEIKKIKVPMLLIHGKNDRNVPFSNFEILQKAARAEDSNIPNIEYIIHDFGHVHFYKMINHHYLLVEFLKKNL